MTLPVWRKDTDGRYECDDGHAMDVALVVELETGFHLPEFDIWLAAQSECGMKTEMLGRRTLAVDALLKNELDTAFRHLEWMLMRRKQVQQEDQLLPDAKRGRKVKQGASDSGKARADEGWKPRSKELQSLVDAIYDEDKDRTYEQIKRLVLKRNPDLNCNLAALKRYTKNPRKK